MIGIYSGAEANEKKGIWLMRHLKLLLQLHSIKLILFSVCAITYLALTSTKTYDSAESEKVVGILPMARVSEESNGEGSQLVKIQDGYQVSISQQLRSQKGGSANSSGIVNAGNPSW